MPQDGIVPDPPRWSMSGHDTAVCIELTTFCVAARALGVRADDAMRPAAEGRGLFPLDDPVSSNARCWCALSRTRRLGHTTRAAEPAVRSDQIADIGRMLDDQVTDNRDQQCEAESDAYFGSPSMGNAAFIAITRVGGAWESLRFLVSQPKGPPTGGT
jgi:hypothetical protein